MRFHAKKEVAVAPAAAAARTTLSTYIKSRAFNFSSLNDVIFQPMRSLDLRIRDHVSISAGTL